MKGICASRITLPGYAVACNGREIEGRGLYRVVYPPGDFVASRFHTERSNVFTISDYPVRRADLIIAVRHPVLINPEIVFFLIIAHNNREHVILLNNDLNSDNERHENYLNLDVGLYKELFINGNFYKELFINFDLDFHKDLNWSTLEVSINVIRGLAPDFLHNPFILPKWTLRRISSLARDASDILMLRVRIRITIYHALGRVLTGKILDDA